MKLQQGQIWKSGDLYFRIVHLERLAVKYKEITNLETRAGTHHHVTKKEFCRLLKTAELVSGGPILPRESGHSDPAEPGPGPALT